MKFCPRCRSTHRGTPNRIAGPGSYTCRNAWHMPALSEEAEEALEFVAAVDDQFSGAPYLEPVFGRNIRPEDMPGEYR